MEYGKKYTIDGKEYGLFWSVQAHITFDSWVIQNQKATMVEGYLTKLICMISAYNDANEAKQKPPVKEELLKRPDYVLQDIFAAVDQQEKADSTRTVEAEPEKAKNAKSANPSS